MKPTLVENIRHVDHELCRQCPHDNDCKEVCIAIEVLVQLAKTKSPMALLEYVYNVGTQLDLDTTVSQSCRGGTKMNRIEEIKERLAFFPRELKDGGFSDNSLAFGARLDIEYLLSKLEIAEKALEKIPELIDTEAFRTASNVAAEALQQIRA